jgi:hypothetical protein
LVTDHDIFTSAEMPRSCMNSALIVTGLASCSRRESSRRLRSFGRRYRTLCWPAVNASS